MNVRRRVEAVGARRGVDLLGVGFILLMALQFGFVVILGKIATRPGGMPVASLLSFRFGVAAIVLVGALLYRHEPLRPARGEAVKLAALGVAGYALEAALFFSSLRHGTAAAAALLFYTYPVIVALLAVAVGRGLPGWLLGGAMAAAVAGAAIVALGGGGVAIDATGVLLALGAALGFGLYLLGADVVLRETNSLTGAAWVAGFASIGLAVWAVATGAGRVPHGWHQWYPILGMGTFTAGAFVCLFAGLRRLGAVRTAIISATEPLTAAALAAALLDERLRAATALGGLLILAGAVAASLARGETRAEAPGP